MTDRIEELFQQVMNEICKDPLRRFAELVAADEREACAKLCEEFGQNLGGHKAHEDNHDDGWQDACCEIETSIRARGNKHD